MRLARRFGPLHGGVYVSELLIPALEALEDAWLEARQDAAFQGELAAMLRDFAGRPTALQEAAALSERVGCRALFKREDLLHGGAHKTNNTLGQGLLARRMGKRRLIAETGAGQHGVATAMVGAKLGLEVTVFMGENDAERQRPNVLRMELFGARVVRVTSGSRGLKDALNEALRHWTAHASDTFYVLGTAAGPHPYPGMVRDFQRVIGDEIREQCLLRFGKLPAAVVACVGGGSNAIGAFAPFLEDRSVRLIGVEAGGRGLDSGAHGATLSRGSPGVLHGMHSYVLQDEDGQILEAHSVSAGLDYPAVGPEHAWLKDSGRAEYVAATDDEALRAFRWMARHEGILPALESSHAVAHALRMAGQLSPDDLLVVNLSGRGDKDLEHALRSLEALDARTGGARP